MIALVITQGATRRLAALRALAANAGLVVAADGGARIARLAGVVPQVIVGDQDSLDPETARWAARRGIDRVRFPLEKDATDGELALRRAAARRATEIWIFSGLAGRLDQVLGHLFLLFEARALGTTARITDGRATAWLADPVSEIPGRPGDTVSLIPISAAVDDVSTEGLRYALVHATLRRGRTLGLSNEVQAPKVVVSKGAGDLLIVHLPRAGR